MNEPTHRSTLYRVLAIALFSRVLFALAITWPGIGDPLYYDDVAHALAEGRGLESRCTWNLLRLPATLPGPACAYWGPGASAIAACGYAVLGPLLKSAQIAMGLVSLGFSLAGLAVARRLLSRESLVLVAGLLLALDVQVGYFSATPDTPIPFALAVTLTLLALARGLEGTPAGFVLAVPFALAAQLTRADGILLPVLVLALAVRETCRRRLTIPNCLVVFALYAALWTPWLLRQRSAFGTPFPSSLSVSVALHDYSDLFRIKTTPTLSAYLVQGPAKILKDKLDAFAANLGTLVLGVNSALLLFFVVGWRSISQHTLAKVYGLYALALLLAMTFVFNFQSISGSLLHSFVALFPFVLCGALSGLDDICARLEAAPKKTVPWRIGRTVRPLGPWLFVLYTAIHMLNALIPESPIRKACTETRMVSAALVPWRAQLTGKRAMSNDSLDAVGLLPAAFIQEPRDAGTAVVFELARRYKLHYLVFFHIKRYTVRTWDAPVYADGTARLTRVDEVALNCPTLHLTGVSLYAFSGL
jgi:hypothetical protein